MQSDKEINLLAYAYEEGQKIEIQGRMLEAAIQMLKMTADKEREKGFANAFVSKTKKHFDEKDKKHLVHVEQTYENYSTAEAYFNQQPQDFISVLGAMAEDLLMQFKQVHLENIKSGTAKQISTTTGEFSEEPTLKLV